MPKLKPGTILVTPEEDAIITAAAMSDPDNRPFTDEEWDAALPYALLGKDFNNRRNKVAISIRLDKDLLEHFKAGGAGWQGRINAALRRVALGEATTGGLHEPDAKAFKHKT